MTASRILKVVLVAGTVLGLQVADTFSGLGVFRVTSTAEARVGRPLTPVSVAGVARRTARRCAVDVYDC